MVSAYRANRATGEALPGLLVAQDVSHFHSVLAHLKTLDEAKKKSTETKPPAEETAPKAPEESSSGTPSEPTQMA